MDKDVSIYAATLAQPGFCDEKFHQAFTNYLPKFYTISHFLDHMLIASRALNGGSTLGEEIFLVNHDSSSTCHYPNFYLKLVEETQQRIIDENVQQKVSTTENPKRHFKFLDV